MSDETGLVVLDHDASPMAMRANLERVKAQLTVMREFFREAMVAGDDYGVIPGTDKPTLLKPGAEKLAELYGYAITIPDIREDEDRETGYYRAVVTVRLVSKRTGEVIADGVGEASTYEGRYRWRNAARTCPKCGAAAIIRGKEQYGGGWICWKKRDGCGASFTEDAAAIVDQPMGKIANDDLHASWNTVLKMAKKRALVDAVLSATRSSSLFTQDLEDSEDTQPAPRGEQAGEKTAAQAEEPAVAEQPKAAGDYVWTETLAALRQERGLTDPKWIAHVVLGSGAEKCTVSDVDGWIQANTPMLAADDEREAWEVAVERLVSLAVDLRQAVD